MQQNPNDFFQGEHACPERGQASFGASGEEQRRGGNPPSGRVQPIGGNDFFSDMGDIQPAQPAAGAENVTAKRRGSGIVSVMMTFAVLCIAVLLLNATVFRLRTVSVEGVPDTYVSTVATAAGLELGESYFAVDENKVRAAVAQNRYLEFLSLTKHFPNAVTLRVRLREQRANLMAMGVLYVIDEDGMALEKGSGTSLDNGLLTVTGMQIREIRVGQVLSAQKAAQFTCFQTILQELVLQQFQDQIAELNVSDMESLYMVTVDGYTVNLGSAANIRAKIGTVRAVVSKLREMGKKDGLIDAAIPGEATYSPANL